MSSEPVYEEVKKRKILYSVDEYKNWLAESTEKSTSSSKKKESDKNEIVFSQPKPEEEIETLRVAHAYDKASDVLPITLNENLLNESVEELNTTVDNLQKVIPEELYANIDAIRSHQSSLNAIENPMYVAAYATRAYEAVYPIYDTVTKEGTMSKQEKDTATKAIAKIEAAYENVASQALITLVTKTLQNKLCALLYIFITIMYNYEDNRNNYDKVRDYVNDLYTKVKGNDTLRVDNVANVEKKLISILIPQELKTEGISLKNHVINIINVLTALNNDTYKTKINSEILTKIKNRKATDEEMDTCLELTGISITRQKKDSNTTKKDVTTLARECRKTLLNLLDEIDKLMKYPVFAADIINGIKCDFKMLIHNILKNLKDNPNLEVNGIIAKFTDIPGDTEKKLTYLMSDDFILYLKQLTHTNINNFTDVLLNIYELTLYCQCDIFTYKKFRSYESASCKVKKITMTEQTKTGACDDIYQKIVNVQLVVCNYLNIDSSDKVEQVVNKYIEYLKETSNFALKDYSAEPIYESLNETINGSVSISSAASTIKDELNSLQRTAETNRFKAFIKGVWRWIKSFIKNKPPEIITSQGLPPSRRSSSVRSSANQKQMSSIANPMYNVLPQKEKSLSKETSRSSRALKPTLTNPVYEATRKNISGVSENPLFKPESNVPIAYNNPLYAEAEKPLVSEKESKSRVTENPVYSTFVRKESKSRVTENPAYSTFVRIKQPSGISNPLYEETHLVKKLSSAKRANDAQLKAELKQEKRIQNSRIKRLKSHLPGIEKHLPPEYSAPSTRDQSRVTTSARALSRTPTSARALSRTPTSARALSRTPTSARALSHVTSSVRTSSAKPPAKVKAEFKCTFTESGHEDAEERQILNNVFNKLDDNTLSIGKHSNNAEMKDKRKNCLKTALLNPNLNRARITELEKNFIGLKSNAKDTIKEKILAITNNNISKKASNMPNAKTKKATAKFKLVGRLSMF